MRHLALAVAAVAACAAVAAAQEPFNARAWLPNDYQNVVHVDLEALRDREIWDELDTGVMKMALRALETEAGFALDHLDRLTMIAMPPLLGGMEARVRELIVFEGNAALGVPDKVARNNSWSMTTIGEYDVRRRERYGDQVFFRPRPEVQIQGSTDLLRPMLEGKPSAGMPCPDIMSLMSKGGDELLYLVLHLNDPLMKRNVERKLFPDVEWPPGDELQYLMVRLRATGDADDPHLEAEAVLRHGRVGAGLTVTAAAVDAFLERIAAEPRFRIAAPIFKDVRCETDRTDYVLRLDLGRVRVAAGRLAMLVLPIIGGGEAVPAAQAERAVPAPAPRKGK